MRDLTILKSAVGSNVAPGSLACLRNNGERKVRIVGVDMSNDPSIKYFVDSFYRVPAATDPTYCDVMLEICKKENVDIYLPGISAEVSTISKRRQEFEALGVILSISNLDSVAIANNKLRTYEVLSKAGINVPNYYGVHSVEDFIQGCTELGYPEKAVCIKIVSGSGSRGVRIVDAHKSRYDIFVHEKPNSFYTSYDDMISILKEAEKKGFEEMLLVEYMPGNEYTVDLLANHGDIVYIAGRENVQSLMSIAQESIIIENEYAYEISRSVVKLLDMDGNVGLDFMMDEQGVPALMDINPRMTATMSLAAIAGMNLPYLRVKQLLGEELPKIELKQGVHLRRRYLETFTDKDGNLLSL